MNIRLGKQLENVQTLAHFPFEMRITQSHSLNCLSPIF